LPGIPGSLEWQSEIPCDPPDQSGYISGPAANGCASYKVADNVASHEAWGLGIYSAFRNPGVTLSHAIEAPRQPNVRFHKMITVRLANNGEIGNVINETGDVATGNVRPRVTNYPD
jgi:hypothetical protein